MQKALVKHSNQEDPISYFIVRNEEDLKEYVEMISNKLQGAITMYMKADSTAYWEFPNSEHNEGDSILHQAYRMCQLTGGNPLMRSSQMLQEKIFTYEKCLNDGKTLLINSKGGFCFLDSSYEVLSIRDFTEEKTYHIGKNTQIINFENDPELEKRTLEYFEEKGDKDPSYIVNLREFSVSDIESVLKEFVGNGGKEVYILTTGMDVDQMRDYIKAINHSDVSRVTFEFTAQTSPEITFILESIEGKEVIVYHGLKDN